MYVQLFLVLLFIALWYQLNVEGFTPLWTTEDKKDYSEHTIGTSLTNMSLADCKTKCVGDTTCKGLVTDFTEGKGSCWLKSDWGTAKDDDKRFTYKLARN